MTLARLDVPHDWRNADPFYAPALERVRTALADPRTPERLVRYYSPTGDYAGSSFTAIGDNAPDRIDEADLLAVSLVGTHVPPPMARALLEPGEVRDRVQALLSTDVLPADARLADVTPPLLEAMNALYVELRALVPPPTDRYLTNWTTAATLCARKRPALFPERDEAICRYLGMWPSRYQVDWQVFYAVMAQDDVRADLERLVARAAESPSVVIDAPDALLRHLGVVLWMHAPRR